MMRKLKRSGILTAALVLSLSLSGCSFFGKTIEWDTQALGAINNVFAINDSKCSGKEAGLYLSNYRNLYGSAYGMDLSTYDFGENSLEEYVEEVTLQELTRIYCMDEMAQERGLILDETEEKLAEDCADAYLEQLGRDQAKLLRLSQRDLTEYYRNYILADKLYRDMLESDDSQISDDEARVIHARMCLVKEEEKVAEVSKALAGGRDFTVVTASYNQADKADVYVTRGMFPEEVERVIFFLENGQRSEPIRTSEGIYFFYIINKYEEERTEENREKIHKDRESAAFHEAYDRFLETAFISLNQSRWEEVKKLDPAGITTDGFFEIYEELSAKK